MPPTSHARFLPEPEMSGANEDDRSLPPGSTGVTPNELPAFQRRRWHRLPLRLWTEGRVDGRLDLHNCVNLSVGGIFIETRDSYAIGRELQIEFSLPGIPESIKVRGRVVSRVSSDGADGSRSGNGIEFVEITQTARTLIARFIEATIEGG